MGGSFHLTAAMMMGVLVFTGCKQKEDKKVSGGGNPPATNQETVNDKDANAQQQDQVTVVSSQCGDSLDKCPKVQFKKPTLIEGGDEKGNLVASVDESTIWKLTLEPDSAIEDRDIEYKVLGLPRDAKITANKGEIQILFRPDETESGFVDVVARVMDRCRLLAKDDTSINCENFEQQIPKADSRFGLIFKVTELPVDTAAAAEARRRKAAAAGCIVEEGSKAVGADEDLSDLLGTVAEAIVSPGDVGACDETKNN